MKGNYLNFLKLNFISLNPQCYLIVYNLIESPQVNAIK